MEFPSTRLPLTPNGTKTLLVTDSTPARPAVFDNLEIGQEVTQRVVLTTAMWDGFMHAAADQARLHHDDDFARSIGFDGRVVQGLMVTSRFSRLIGMYLPGEGAIVENISFTFRRPTVCGQELLYRLAISRLRPAHRIAELELSASADGIDHVTGRCRCLVREPAR